VFYTTVPFGLTPPEHVAWIDAGGGQTLWDELYAPFGTKPFMGGNTGICMGGWFRRELNSADDLKGLKILSLGLGGEIYRRLCATPQTTSPGEILTSMQSGLIDGAEFVGPGSDIALGLFRVATFYYAPGFNKPNGTGECILSLKMWEGLDSEMKAIVQHACSSEAAFPLAEMERLNAEALAALTGQYGVKLRIFPKPRHGGSSASKRRGRRARGQERGRAQDSREAAGRSQYGRRADRSRGRRSAAVEIGGDAAVVPVARGSEARSPRAGPHHRPGSRRLRDLKIRSRRTG